MLDSSGRDVLSLIRGDRSSEGFLIYELQMLWESVKIVIQLLFGIAASAMILPHSSNQKMLEDPVEEGESIW
jgi:hypothetical protein